MTYDPLSYGQIKLTDKVPVPGETPDDLLFEDAGPTSQLSAPEQANTDWDLLDPETEAHRQDTSDVSAADEFGADVLGESVPSLMSETAPPPMEPVPPPAMEPPPRPSIMPPEPMGEPQQAEPRPRPVAPATKTPTVAKRPISRRMRQPAPPRMIGKLAPLVVFVGGGSLSAWFYMVDQNMIMAAMIGASSLVGAALARVMFR